jgi:adenylate cyclase class 2
MEQKMDESLEIEVKFLVDDPAGLRKRILDVGWSSQGKFFETNIRFEDENNGLLKKKHLLRLRQDNKATLTFKSKPQVDDSRYKIQHELEVEVSHFDTMKTILECLGFHREQVYEKWRETFKAGDALICLDEMPFACFIEIEGCKTDIEAVSKKLGFLPSRTITANYLEIFARIKTCEDLTFTDITFENFKHLSGDYKKHIMAFEAADILNSQTGVNP